MDRLTQDFLQFEKEKDLFERKYCGVYYWQVIRLAVGLIICGYEDTNAIPDAIVKKNWKIKEYIALCKNYLTDVFNYYHLKKCDILYFDQGIPYAYRDVDGELVDVYFGCFEYENIYQIQRCYYNEGSRRNPQNPGVGKGLTLPDRLILKIQSMVQSQRYTDLREEEFIRFLCEEIRIKYNKNISADGLIRKVRKICKTYKIYEKYYIKILSKTAPKAIVLHCYYSSDFFILFKIAKEFSIPVIELQHGRTNNHIAYNYLDVSMKGKELPDYLFTYGSFWEKQMQLPVGMKTVTIGNPFLEAMKEKYKNIIPDEKAIVFYTSDFFMDGQVVEKLAVEFCERYGDKGYRIYFKIHPDEAAVWKERYLLLCDSKEIQMADPAMSVYRLFASAKHHVFVYSTVMYEAAKFDVCRYAYNFEGALQNAFDEMQHPLIEKGIVQRIHNAQELEYLVSKGMKTDADFVNELWEPNAKEKGQKALEEIIKRGAK